MAESLSPVLLWFRYDLRLQDNPALEAAVSSGRPIIPIYIWSPAEESPWEPQGAQRWWLHRALESLQEDLQKRSLELIFRQGAAGKELHSLVEDTGAEVVYWNRRYEPAFVERDTQVKKSLQKAGVEVESFNGSLLFEPWKVSTGSGNPYKVYTPFWKNVKDRSVQRPEESDLTNLQNRGPEKWPSSLRLGAFNLLPEARWYEKLESVWTPSELSARQRLQQFIKEDLEDYTDNRNFPSVSGTSGLSPYLHFGHISPRQIWWTVKDSGKASGKGGTTFLKEIVWREFAYHVLFHFPDTPESPLRAEFKEFPWDKDSEVLKRWQEGRTGYPLVDAGMRQLYEEGWMHNRVRMVVASLLVKHLLQPWQEGARWFWYTLVDGDLASNTLGWQWAGGCGADAAPYFRIFNPMTQSEKFDAEGDYIRRYVPELSKLEAPHIHTPWEASDSVLEAAGIRLGEDYPNPIIEHKAGRERALKAFEAVKKN